MIDYYNSEIYKDALKQKTKVLRIYLLILVVYLLFSAGMFFWFTTLTYESNVVVTIKLIHYPITLFFLVFSVFYIGIKHNRVKKFCNECYHLENGIREENEGTFFDYSEDLQDKGGVDFKAIVFLEWNKYKKDYFERKVLVFYELPFPELEPEKKYKFITQSNVLIKYQEIED